ncbi:hypothetical protein GGTG_01781 [Gaeumannomyces tritici R3-111a-1]|uniref:Uncharacterized protein n=1 Tax=Gaeumannomyces tritici (strain R3-111a-1) TaxID=644352 RepID=J3NKJ0_GAET3|nr:hypothetical protein GGTG_01781 [Gaeumannomyces tritici R3-111a-1]EJT81807.1 hypothetical protein GGTG_01781 [Gaeumannomyces tritici R3-111a-1]
MQSASTAEEHVWCLRRKAVGQSREQRLSESGRFARPNQRGPERIRAESHRGICS